MEDIQARSPASQQNVLEGLPRPQLQKLAKEAGLKANGKSVDIIKSLLEVLQLNGGAGSQEQPAETQPATQEPAAEDAQAGDAADAGPPPLPPLTTRKRRAREAEPQPTASKRLRTARKPRAPPAEEQPQDAAMPDLTVVSPPPALKLPRASPGPAQPAPPAAEQLPAATEPVAEAGAGPEAAAAKAPAAGPEAGPEALEQSPPVAQPAGQEPAGALPAAAAGEAAAGAGEPAQQVAGAPAAAERARDAGEGGAMETEQPEAGGEGRAAAGQEAAAQAAADAGQPEAGGKQPDELAQLEALVFGGSGDGGSAPAEAAAASPTAAGAQPAGPMGSWVCHNPLFGDGGEAGAAGGAAAGASSGAAPGSVTVVSGSGSLGSRPPSGAGEREAFERGRKSGMWLGAQQSQLGQLEEQWGSYKTASKRGWAMPSLADVQAEGLKLAASGYTTVATPMRMGVAPRKRKAGELAAAAGGGTARPSGGGGRGRRLGARENAGVPRTPSRLAPGSAAKGQPTPSRHAPLGAADNQRPAGERARAGGKAASDGLSRAKRAEASFAARRAAGLAKARK